MFLCKICHNADKCPCVIGGYSVGLCESCGGTDECVDCQRGWVKRRPRKAKAKQVEGPQIFDLETLSGVFWLYVEDGMYVDSAVELWSDIERDLIRAQRRAEMTAEPKETESVVDPSFFVNVPPQVAPPSEREVCDG